MLAEQVFEGEAELGFFVAVLDDDGSVDAEAPLGGFAFLDGAGAGDDDGVFWNDEGAVAFGADDGSVDDVVDGSAAGEDGSGGEDGALADDGAFVNAAVSADEDIVFKDDGIGVDGLENAADLGCGAEVDMLADLGATADEGVGVDHGAFVDVCADVDVHGRHADDAGSEVGSAADGGAAGDDAHLLGRGELARGVGVLVDEGEVVAGGGELAEAETEENAALDPGVDAPAVGVGDVRLGGADGSVFEGIAKLVEGGEGVGIADGVGSGGEVLFDSGVKEILGHRESLAMNGEWAVSFWFVDLD